MTLAKKNGNKKWPVDHMPMQNALVQCGFPKWPKYLQGSIVIEIAGAESEPAKLRTASAADSIGK